MDMNVQTTLDHVLRLAHGALLVPLKKSAAIVGLDPHTIRNKMSEERRKAAAAGRDVDWTTWDLAPLAPVWQGRNVFFRAIDLAARADMGICKKIRLGAPSNEEKQAAQAAGVSVQEWRARST